MTKKGRGQAISIDAELAQCPIEVRFDRANREEELTCDVGVAQALCGERGNLMLARREMFRVVTEGSQQG